MQANAERLSIQKAFEVIARVTYYREVTRLPPMCQLAASASGRAVGAPATYLGPQTRDGGRAKYPGEA